MNFKNKNFFSNLIPCVFMSIMSSTLPAFADTVKVLPPSHYLTEPTASLAAYSGLGAAMPGDYSAIDVNPAIMSAFRNQYLIFADTAKDAHTGLLDFGVLDSASTEVAASVRFRQSIPGYEEQRDRRLSLALSYEIPKTNLSLGVSFDYEQLSLSSFSKYNDSNYFGGIGFLYEYITSSGRPFFVGVGVNHISDSYIPVQYDIGLSTTFFDGFYAISLDTLLASEGGLQQVSSGLDIIANRFLDLKGSFGYRPKIKKNVWGAGIFFHAPVLQVFYTFASSDSNVTTKIRQTAGLALNFAM